MVQTVESTKLPSQRSKILQRYGSDLLARPDLCAELIQEAKTGPLSDGQVSVLAAALDEARMADEAAQRRGRDFLNEMLDEVALLNTDLTFKAALSLSSAWRCAGLTPPPSLAYGVISEDLDAVTNIDDIPNIPDEILDAFLKDFKEIGEKSVSAMVALLDQILPTLPHNVRIAFICELTTRSEPLCGEAAVALLLAKDASMRIGALAGLTLRQKAGDLSQDLFSRITLIRSWLQDTDTLQGVDAIVRTALKSGTQIRETRAKPKIHRVVSSMIDGSGAQSISMAIKFGSRRVLAVLLFKQGFGVKDAFVIPCSSATEQKQMIEQIADESAALDTTADYAFNALSWALADGQAMGTVPAAGLLDVVETAGFSDLRPRHVEIADIISVADPKGEVAALSARARGKLIMDSDYWPDDFRISDSWFEYSDASSEAIESGTTQNSIDRKLWQHLETRRNFWSMIFARNAALLAAAKDHTASEFIAVAQAMAEGRDLKKTPIMRFVHEVSCEVWIREDGPPMRSGSVGVIEERIPPGTSAQVGSFGIKERKALEKILRQATIKLPWFEGFLTGLCTAPKFIKPPDWIDPILSVIVGSFAHKRDMQKTLDLIVLAYSHRQSLLRDRSPSNVLFPADPMLFSIWADGYLAVWNLHESHWPAKSLGKEGKIMRKFLEQAADFKTRADQSQVLRDWLIACAEKQK